ncbi:hypothetical protein VTO42DRAFT_2417 [Malbranchea cinnamomea]
MPWRDFQCCSLLNYIFCPSHQISHWNREVRIGVKIKEAETSTVVIWALKRVHCHLLRSFLVVYSLLQIPDLLLRLGAHFWHQILGLRFLNHPLKCLRQFSIDLTGFSALILLDFFNRHGGSGLDFFNGSCSRRRRVNGIETQDV